MTEKCECYTPQEHERLGHTADYDATQRLMAAMFCKVEQDWPEGPCCDGSIPCAHPPIWYCAEHDWWEDDHSEGVCGYALMLAGVAFGTRVFPPKEGDDD